MALFLAVLGPGLITSNVNNEAGGIFTYSLAGAQLGYTILWSLIPMAFALYVTEEMCARMGAVTGKGLSDLIREEFGFRVTFFVMLAVLVVNQGNVLAQFAGVASAAGNRAVATFQQELARLEKLLDKVCSRHGENHPELFSLRGAFEHLKQDLIPHMLKEEQVLFPYVARMEEAVSEGRAVPPPFFVTVQNPVRMMTSEHETAGDLLAEIDALINRYGSDALAEEFIRYE